ncbi:MYB and HSA domain protein [Ophiocordyceps sinensis CO18]|uniref:MYB and HSA domain protein n=1 Tax=Ophiocordyceps sinensis (strain Co18 / CGMCC 3.14243) TaxID=911162 RepID=T5A1C6_OPHSC|nr:MYB and HSA domain protein [Ophiocordyceps sinensis CO18]
MNGGLSAPTQMNGTPQTQMQAAQGQHRLAMPNQQPDAGLMLRAQRISEQQRAAVQIQQAQHQQHHHQQGNPGGVSQHNSPPLRNNINQTTFMNNAQAMMASYGAAATNGNNVGATQATGLHMPSAATTPSPGQRAHPPLPPGIAAQVSHLETGFRAKNPNLTPEQARQLATEHLTRNMMAQQRQNAMNAAAGASGQTGIASLPHHQHHLLQQQQRQQTPQQKPPAPTPPVQQQPQPLYQQHAATKQSTPVPLVATPAAASASPVQSQQRAPSGSATPSAVGK